MHRTTSQGLGAIFMKPASCILYFLLSDPVDNRSWHFVAGSYGYCALIIHFVVRSCRSRIFISCSVLRSWASWILRILYPKILFLGLLASELIDTQFSWSSATWLLLLNIRKKQVSKVNPRYLKMGIRLGHPPCEPDQGSMAPSIWCHRGSNRWSNRGQEASGIDRAAWVVRKSLG